MNSGDNRFLGYAWAALIVTGTVLALVAGCADQGPTNLYSQTFFGQTQAGAQIQVWGEQESTILSAVTPSAGLDGYDIWLKNTGSGGTVGPILATIVTTANPCAMPVTFGASVATAIFGSKGEVINPGQVLRGQACSANGTVMNSQFSYEVAYNSVSCTGSSVNFNLTATDSRGSSWTGSFSGVTQ